MEAAAMSSVGVPAAVEVAEMAAVAVVPSPMFLLC